MLVADVSLGNSYKVYHHDNSLTAPPAGYNSVHGVGRTDAVQSDFEVTCRLQIEDFVKLEYHILKAVSVTKIRGTSLHCV